MFLNERAQELIKELRGNSMKLYIIMLVVGIILLLATNSEYCLSNITGLAMAYTACHKLNMFYE